MRKLILMTLCLSISQFVFAQQPSVTSNTEEYLEVRFLPKQGMSYRMAPDLPFQRTGFFNKNLKPYLKQDPESLKYYKKYNRSFFGVGAGATIYGLGAVATFSGVLESNVNAVRGGSVAMVAGLGLVLWSNNRSVSSLHQSIDSYNRNKNSNSQNAEYLEIFPHPITIWQYRTKPSENYQYTGLFGSKLKPHVEQDEAAYDAYKKYKAGHIAYTTGNLVELTGTGMMLYGFLANDPDLARNGLFTSVGGLVGIFISRRIMTNNIYRAADLINHQKSPLLNSSFIPSIQPSSHSAGLGLVWKIE